METLLSQQGLLYSGVLFSSMALVVLCEAFIPRRQLTQPMGRRWLSHMVIAGFGAVLVKILFPLAPIMVALYAADRGWGLFNQGDVPVSAALLVTLLILDFSAWLQHWLLHNVPLLWRLHAVHHSDPDYDFSTGLRFHPLEGCYTWLAEALTVVLLGAPAIAVLIYKLVQAIMASFGHGNLLLPAKLDRTLRLVLITPDLHRVHHSALERESNSNFGGVTPWWDRLFRTYTDQPAAGHERMSFGLEGFSHKNAISLYHMLLQPFRPAR